MVAFYARRYIVYGGTGYYWQDAVPFAPEEIGAYWSGWPSLIARLIRDKAISERKPEGDPPWPEMRRTAKPMFGVIEHDPNALHRSDPRDAWRSDSLSDFRI